MRKSFVLFCIAFFCGVESTSYAADIQAVLDSADGSSAFVVQDSGSTTVGSLDSDGNTVFKGGLRIDAGGTENTTAETLEVDRDITIGKGVTAGSTDVIINFGGASAQTLEYDATDDNFKFSDNIEMDWTYKLIEAAEVSTNLLGVGATSYGSATVVIAIGNAGTVPSASITDGVLLYAQDVAASSELKVRDEAGNVTTLSPHAFLLAPKSEPMAWSYYSENQKAGKRINVDMLKAMRLLEKLTGEKLVYIEDIEEDQGKK